MKEWMRTYLIETFGDVIRDSQIHEDTGGLWTNTNKGTNPRSAGSAWKISSLMIRQAS
jgi:predicted Rdx family selenoprotein